MTEAVEVDKRGRVTVITLRREAKRNAIDATITDGLDRALNDFEDDPEQWCAILTGGTRCFSAGADLAAGPGLPTPRGGIAGIITRARNKPLIAAVEGLALGGGMELVLCCDLVVAATDARFGLPEPKRGLMADFGGAFRITRHLPPNVAREMLLTAGELDAPRAERLGLVNRLTEPGEALTAAIDLAEKICENAPLAVRGSLRVANAAITADETQLWRLSDDIHAALLRSQDLIEGIAAFFEKRRARWTGK
ncbi:enoyl-CoA hydratase-related protein [Nocardia bovistercoris]|uniref:Enoyl-CoA hydratase/isomerase family protein n=1 Tax=Nocardia bovistercoris TaxID=2785916 RepID=A0A931IAJ2_9NOCA|nr:enoyl-CoA hydratase-related protein [Nocardia bovistercoris]MBH0776657.1 enoyl-CoA hydratase/isomerase family protein [Nocardia bovistercoris]